MNTFFIVGLPRSRTAWLANFLTNGNSFCHHEAMRTCSNLDELAAKLDDHANFAEIGDADPTLCPILPQVIERFPAAKFVFIFRDIHDVAESHKTAFPKLDVSLDKMEEWDLKMRQALALLLDTLRPSQKLSLGYEDLNKPELCDKIHRFCLGRPMNVSRWEMLNGLRVTTIAEKAAATLAPWAKIAVSHLSNPLPASCKAWYELIAQLCGKEQAARDWLSELWAAALLWDHLTDGDAVNLAQAELVFEALLLKWPLNQFYMKHAAWLAPTLSNALSAWRDGGRARHYDIYTESALTVAFLIGGKDYAKQFSARVRAAAAAMLSDDDRQDVEKPNNKEAA
jgi:hypothetical protein